MKRILCFLINIYYSLKMPGLINFSGHEFIEVENTKEPDDEGKFWQTLKCKRCGVIDKAWSNYPIL